MKSSNILLVLLFSVTLLMGCDDVIYVSETVLSDTRDTVYPLSDGVYLRLDSLSSTDSGLSSDEIAKYLSPTEQLLLSSGIIVPLKYEKDGNLQIKRLNSCYQVFYKSEGKVSESAVTFEKVQDQIYLREETSDGKIAGMCPDKEHKRGTTYHLVKIQNNQLYFSFFDDGDGNQKPGLLDKDDRALKSFRKWVESLSRVTRWRYGIKTVGKDSWKLTSTKAIKAFAKEKASSFTFLNEPYYMSQGEASQYKKEIKLYSKIQKIKARLKSEKAQKVAELKKREEAEKNDGVIRYAFGRKLGVKRTSRLDSITYHTVTDLAEKSDYFQDYYELSTPESKQVFSIYGISQNLDATTCRKKAKEVMSVLRVKYGAPAPHAPVTNYILGQSQKDVDRSFLYFQRIEQEKHGKLIELLCVTDGNKIQEKREKYKAAGCQLAQNLYDSAIAKPFFLHLSEYNLYFQYPRPGYSDYKNNIIPIWIPDNTLYPAPVPAESISYNQNYRKCELNKNNDIFRLFIRYSDTELEGLIQTERNNLKRAKTLNSKKAKGL